ncbi:MAG: hypothetical protein WC614_04555 [bacterium]
MKNVDNGGNVTIMLRQKAEKILLSKYDKAIGKVRTEHRELSERIKKEVVSELGIDKSVEALVELYEKTEALESEIKEQLGSGYGYTNWKDWKAGIFHGDKIDKLVESKVKPQIDVAKEELRLKELKDKLFEDLWMAGQTKAVKDVLSKMI